MKRAIFFLLEEYADWQIAYLASQLNQQKNWTIKTASLTKQVTSMGGFKTEVDYTIEKIPKKMDLLVLVEGSSWEFKNSLLKKTIAQALSNGIVVGAICGAVDFLAQNGLLSDYHHTGNPQISWQEASQYINPQQFHSRQVVQDRNLVTANGTAALEFTEALLKAVDFTDQQTIEKTMDLQRMGYYAYSQEYGDPY
ncbi:DJ-1/PfpI family protein [Enterococcus sp. 669A]|uniref:DJ-1/PfpI family protein n=1 Tax=Candidatus Enterococcus moelleringii TaxID=2815325 RepID=A0ABS3LA59_9ENTE|nr:DJ-1/PfpI family protein [Enterococcus sp. 669A]MBO1305626.1 DJ-1/PfpI family protein [Enterococcus sp. 669A]